MRTQAHAELPGPERAGGAFACFRDSGWKRVQYWCVLGSEGCVSKADDHILPDSLVVCQTEIRDLSRMCIVLRGQDGVIEQARRQLEDLVGPQTLHTFLRALETDQGCR